MCIQNTNMHAHTFTYTFIGIHISIHFHVYKHIYRHEHENMFDIITNKNAYKKYIIVKVNLACMQYTFI